jgi:lipopolysaccharide biosynthesis glycosyltransferase
VDDRPVSIACAADENYVRPLAAMLRSVVDNLGEGRTAEIYVLHSNISSADQSKVVEGWPSRCTVNWIETDSKLFAGLPLWGRMPVSTYFRLAMADMLPASLARVIWLDCDLLVIDDIAELWDVGIDGHHAGAAQDAVVPFVSSRFGIARYADLGIDARARYFNAGVMLIDLERWRADSIQSRAADYLMKHQSTVMFWDQEGLNAVLAGKWAEIDERWNHNASVPRINGAKAKSPSIVHFAGSLKPWRYRTRHALRKLYYDYLDRTAYAGWRPGPSVAAAVISFYEESGLRSVMYPAENIGMRVVRGLSQR